MKGRKIAIVGLGKSGLAAARLCLREGAKVVGFDEGGQAGPEVNALVGEGMALRLGPLGADAFAGFDRVVVSPGVPPREAFDAAEANGTPVIGELELAAHFTETPIVLIGGTNGKSTVTALVAAMIEAAGQAVFIGGNFGTPLAEAVLDDRGYDALVVEISSFQAERVPELRAKVHALLNITEDHLDRYPDFAAYAQAKGNPFVNMTADDFAVIPQGDPRCAAQAARGGAQVVTFSGEESPEATVALDPTGKALVDRRRGLLVPLAHSPLRGQHNVSNIAAAIAVASALELPGAAIVGGLERFSGLPHRAVMVRERAGVRFYDDSKATNVGAAVAALAGLVEPKAVLIAGGRDKQGDYAPLVEALAQKGRALVLIGEAADRLAEAVGDTVPVVRAASLEEAVSRAAALASPGDAVLLSPACSSYDMFKSFAARGDAFAAAVLALAEEDA
ncbi:MAG: UDP-N-acetylmuramoyl-L-alanine--D-glutamate ligase [Polyangiaceae bacterium]